MALTPELPAVVPAALIEAAGRTIYDAAIRTPLLRLPPCPSAPRSAHPPEIWLKLENLQAVGSFKIRGARNAIAGLDPAVLARGVYTASAGNMALGVAWCARERGIPCTVIVPDSAPRAKLDPVERLGARIVPVPFERWWGVLRDHGAASYDGTFIHPVANPSVLAGNATIGLELAGQLPGMDTVLVPFGGGGLCCGIASGLRAAGSAARVIGCEVATAAPLRAALAAGMPVPIERQPSFVDGIGGAGVLPEMWPAISGLLAGAVVVSLEEIRAAIRLLAQRVHVIAEGAGAAPVAAACSEQVAGSRLCCVVSGGNLDPGVLAGILTAGSG